MGPSTTCTQTCVLQPTAQQRAAQTRRWGGATRETNPSSGSLSGRRKKKKGSSREPQVTLFDRSAIITVDIFSTAPNFLSSSKSAFHLSGNGKQIKWKVLVFRPSADWGRLNDIARRGLFGLFKETSWTWELLILCCFHRSASATKMDSSAHLKCH